MFKLELLFPGIDFIRAILHTGEGVNIHVYSHIFYAR